MEQRLDQRVVQVLRHEDLPGRLAPLPVELGHAVDECRRGELDVRVVEDDRRVVAAELQLEGGEVRRRGGGDRATRRCPTREGYGAHARVPGQLGAHCRGPVHQLERRRRESVPAHHVLDHVGDDLASAGRPLGRLEDDRAAGGEGARELRHRDEGRCVPRGEHEGGTERTAQEHHAAVGVEHVRLAHGAQLLERAEHPRADVGGHGSRHPNRVAGGQRVLVGEVGLTQRQAGGDFLEDGCARIDRHRGQRPAAVQRVRSGQGTLHLVWGRCELGRQHGTGVRIGERAQGHGGLLPGSVHQVDLGSGRLQGGEGRHRHPVLGVGSVEGHGIGCRTYVDRAVMPRLLRSGAPRGRCRGRASVGDPR